MTPLTHGQIRALRDWVGQLQRILQWEADHDFVNSRGHSGHFAEVLARGLAEAPLATVRDSATCAELQAGFSTYSTWRPQQRRHWVARTRQWLHQQRQRLHLQAQTETQATGPSPDQPSPRPQTPPLAHVQGIGPRLAARLMGVGLQTVEDLLRHYPRDYIDYSRLLRIRALRPGETVTVVGTVGRSHAFVSSRNHNLAILELQLQDSTGRLKVTRFYMGRRFTSPKWLQRQRRLFPQGATVAASGLVKTGPYGLSLQDPLLEVLDSGPGTTAASPGRRILPVYPPVEGLSGESLRRAVQAVLPMACRQQDHLTEPWRQRFGVIHLAEAFTAIHQPASEAARQAARHRLVFDEFLELQLGLLRRRQRQQAQAMADLTLTGASDLAAAFLALLPFRLTRAQERVLLQVRNDLQGATPMGRLVQGDVGSGKTVVAIIALLEVIAAGGQGALMAPTEVLAAQHYRKLCDWMVQLHVPIALLTGSTPERQRQAVLRDLATGAVKLVVGTHALLEEPVTFFRLGLVVIDEQHRFGVHQRSRLLNKGEAPHLLTMTATPIPRTLALSIHGDLEVSQIDGLPPGRQPVTTTILTPGEREQAYGAIRTVASRGQRAYVILPLVDESDKLKLRSAVQEHQRLVKAVFPNLNVVLLHGRLSPGAKQDVLEAFVGGKAQVLVSTTVVEVGMDVPDATVMVIEHAERFGLAQLHQLRGRIGRGQDPSRCFLVSESRQAVARQRLEVLARSQDGFEIAEMDLRFRGPGQVLGTRQSGLPDLALASLTSDGSVLEKARDAARLLLKEDPQLRTLPRLRARLADHDTRLASAARLN
ncbi:MAG: ATP-dependent DNA helicase RecG [Synechococcus sp. SB0667_bin_8]|nr:ATP-dependent DNA helicase RecG [Cyanobacteria bacterium MAG IRC3_bin_20]MDE0646766.1 ATP-dependent DNA helicase RecG [Cyanobacteria bacterium MAG IRC4_bin_6]MXX09617.1 ATP-dependent DNA helicase RecG [Synechococcus sp. SB0667_bin_8]MYF19450.1 ATP-dependent DNA helicase RecG [Synechococcus sp. SB0677_bin_5]